MLKLAVPLVAAFMLQQGWRVDECVTPCEARIKGDNDKQPTTCWRRRGESGGNGNEPRFRYYNSFVGTSRGNAAKKKRRLHQHHRYLPHAETGRASGWVEVEGVPELSCAPLSRNLSTSTPSPYTKIRLYSHSIRFNLSQLILCNARRSPTH